MLMLPLLCPHETAQFVALSARGASASRDWIGLAAVTVY